MPERTEASLSSSTLSSTPNAAGQKKKLIIRWAVRLGGTALLVFFLLRLNLDFGRLWQEIRTSNLWLVAFAIVLVFPMIAIKAWRWQTILKDLGINISFGQAYRYYSLGVSAASFTPGQAGDFIKAWHLQAQGYSLGLGLVSNILDRLFDIAALVLLAATGLLVLGADFVSILPALLALAVGVIAGLVVLSVPGLRNRLLGFALKLFLRKKARQLGEENLAREEAEAEKRLGPVNFVPVFVQTVLGTAIVLFRVWLLALALGMHLGFMELIASSSMATVVSLIPVSVGGIGARDLALVGILTKLGYAKEQAIGLSTYILMLNLVNLVAGLVVWGGKKGTKSAPLEVR
ncbi:MAG TPA: lysylphosphatidylglycerol synthase transmembrane domain-containing protein [Chloroflexia bacterium]|nr:lysylphosphatidylglycerol synthase transmembrane domain-containing protein [Chloroflexia bacterium]